MKKPFNVKELCEYIWYLEDKYNLLDFEINGVKPWQAHRIEIYYLLGKHFGVFEKHYSRDVTWKEKFNLFTNLLKNIIFHNPLFSLKDVDYLVFSHPRSKIVDNQPIDIYTHYFVKELLNNNISFLEFEGHYEGKHIRPFKSYKRYTDFISIYKNLFYKFYKISITNEQIKIIERLENEIKLPMIKKLFIERVKKFLITYNMYKKILIKTKAKKVFLTVAYSNPELIKAAKDLNIKTIEFQHGTFSKYHLGYSYPNKQYIEYLPDEFWVWNEYWKDLITFPKNLTLKIYSFKYLETEKKKYSLKKKQNQLIVVGQGGLTDRMAKKILDNYEFFKNFEIIFKLHPNEYDIYLKYKYLHMLKNKTKIKILKEVNLYEYFAESKYQAGVFSTALYEGVEFDCKTILFDLPGLEYMNKFIQKYNPIII